MVINPIVGVCIPIKRISGFPIKGWMTIPNTRSWDPGSFVFDMFDGDMLKIWDADGNVLLGPRDYQMSNEKTLAVYGI